MSSDIPKSSFPQKELKAHALQILKYNQILDWACIISPLPFNYLKCKQNAKAVEHSSFSFPSHFTCSWNQYMSTKWAKYNTSRLSIDHFNDQMPSYRVFRPSIIWKLKESLDNITKLVKLARASEHSNQAIKNLESSITLYHLVDLLFKWIRRSINDVVITKSDKILVGQTMLNKGKMSVLTC